MKKLFVVLSLLAVLAFGAVPSQALVGMPDDVPGRDVLFPFFYVNQPGFGNQNTLITITDVLGCSHATLPELHLILYNIKSVPILNIPIDMTKFDVWVDNVYRLIDTYASAQGKLDLQAFNDRGVAIPGVWAGYIFIENYNRCLVGTSADPWNNNLISHVYQVNLLAGQASTANGVKIEYSPVGFVNNARQGVKYFPDDTGFSEAFSPDALYAGKGLLINGAVPVNQANWFRLLPRYYIHDANAANLLFIWKSANTLTPAPAPFPIHVIFWDEAEEWASADIYLPWELNIITVKDIVPGLFAGVYPYAGWIDIFMPDPYGNGGGYQAFKPELQWVGYSWQRAFGSAQEAWDGIHPMDRDAGYHSPLYPRENWLWEWPY